MECPGFIDLWCRMAPQRGDLGFEGFKRHFVVCPRLLPARALCHAVDWRFLVTCSLLSDLPAGCMVSSLSSILEVSCVKCV